MTVPPSGDDGRPERPSPDHLGARIAELREAAGLTVDQVASRTRIRASLLQSMERGDFAPCGGAVYARGHLRSVARVIGADAQELVDGYDRMAGEAPPSAARIAEAPHEPAAHVPFAELSDRPVPTPVQVTGSQDPATELPEHDRSRGPALVLPGARTVERRRGSPMLLLGIGVAALIVIVAGIALAIPQHHGSPSTTLGAPASPSTTPPPTSASAPTTPTAPVTLAAAGVNVTVAVSSQASWVHVTGSSGTLVFQGTLAPGTSKAFHDAQTLSFVFGYAPAIDLTYNGQHIGAPPDGGGGDVAHATFTASQTSG
ncbi:MAG: helix-turn-helix domain-containing protein [Mycobacteriales bacterium]